MAVWCELVAIGSCVVTHPSMDVFGQAGSGVTVQVLAGLSLAVAGLAVQDDEDPIARLTRMVRRATAGADVDFDLNRDDEIGELSAAIAALVEDRETTAPEQRQAERYRREFYEITIDSSIDDGEKLRRVLELGCDRLGVENGLLTTIDPESGRYEVEMAVGSDFVTEGTVTPLEETFCRRTIDADDVLGIYDAPEEGYEHDPGFKRWNIGCYIGAKTLVDGALYGTVCFVNESPRSTPFSTEEKVFVDLLSRWISQVLERREHADERRIARRSFAAAPVGIVITDPNRPDNPVVSTNPAFEEITGYSEAAVVGRNCRFLQGEETDPESVATLRRAVDAAEPAVVELKNYRKDGTPFWNRVSIAPVRNEAGELVNFVGFQEDVTRRKERQEAYVRYQEFTDDILDAIDDVFYVIETDGSYRRWNRSFEALTGYAKDEIEEMHALDFFPEDRWEEITAAIEGVFETGDGRVEAPVLTKSGEEVPYEFVAAELEDPDDEPVLVGIGRDISERRRYEAELERTTDMLQQAGRLAKIGGWEIDLEASPPEIFWTDELYDIHDVPTDTSIDLDRALEFYHPDDREYIQNRIDHAIDTGRGYDMEVRALTADGDVRWIHALGEAVVEAGETVRIRGSIQDITAQKEREFALESLHESTRGLLNAERSVEAAQIVVDAAASALDVSAVAIYLYDEDQNRLEPAASSQHVAEYLQQGLATVGPQDDSLLWHSFVTDSLTVIDSPERERTERLLGNRIEDGLVIPIGTHGVLLAISEEGPIDADTRRLFETLVASAAAGLDRIAGEQELRERDAELEARNDRLRRQMRINETIRSVSKTLVGATNRTELERAVCEELVASEDVAFAWIGGFDGPEATLEPRVWAGDDRGYLDSDVFSRTAPAPEPAVAAAERGDSVLVETVASDVQGEPWRRAALAANFQSVLAVPLVLDDYRYGVLAVYATESGSFRDLERTVFAELGESIANAIGAVSTRQALYSDSLVALTLRIDASKDPLCRIAAAADCTVAFEGLATDSEEETRLFLSVSGTTVSAVTEVLDNRYNVRDHRLVRETEDGGVFEVTLESGSIVRTLIRHGGHPRTVTADATGLEVEVDVPMGTDVRSFVEMLEGEGSVELRARREVTRSLQTRSGVIETMLDELTKRQQEVLRTAYLAGFFNWPRDTTGEELAAMLDVSQPTINRHLRLAERTIMRQLFDDDPPRD